MNQQPKCRIIICQCQTNLCKIQQKEGSLIRLFFSCKVRIGYPIYVFVFYVCVFKYLNKQKYILNHTKSAFFFLQNQRLFFFLGRFCSHNYTVGVPLLQRKIENKKCMNSPTQSLYSYFWNKIFFIFIIHTVYLMMCTF